MFDLAMFNFVEFMALIPICTTTVWILKWHWWVASVGHTLTKWPKASHSGAADYAGVTPRRWQKTRHSPSICWEAAQLPSTESTLTSVAWMICEGAALRFTPQRLERLVRELVNTGFGFRPVSERLLSACQSLVATQVKKNKTKHINLIHAWQTKLAVSVSLLSISAASVCGFGCVEIFIYINKSPTQSALRRLLWADKERILPQEWHCSNKPHCVRVASTKGLNSFGWRLQRESCIWSANHWFYRVNHTLQQSSKHSWPWKLSIIIILSWICCFSLTGQTSSCDSFEI